MTNAIMVVNNQAIIEVYRADGGLAERYLGPSAEQLRADHDAHRCGVFCPHCWQEAMDYLESHPA